MIDLQKVTRSILVVSAITISLLTANPANGKDFKIGVIKESFVHGNCVSFLPNTKKNMIVVPYSKPAIAWMNIDGQDVRLRQTMVKVIKEDIRYVAKYQSNSTLVTIDSRVIKSGGRKGIVGLEYQETVDKISINRGDKTKVIKTNGQCN